MHLVRMAAAAAFAVSCIAASSTSAAQIDVVASIKPIHSLVAGVMRDVAIPKLIVEGAGSPHTYSMRPSQAAALEQAKLVFWVGPDLEHFLMDPLKTLASGATVVELEEAPGVVKLDPREGGSFEPEADEDEHGHGDHDHGEETVDPHMWLDPENAKAMVTAIEKALAKADPDHAEKYAANAAELKERIDNLEAETRAELAPVKGRPFVVFHDAYHYFEKRFGLHAAGSITVDPQAAPGAARLREIHDKLAGTNAACVFAEPQFRSTTIDVVTEGTGARTGVLDPLGAEIANGPDLYFRLIANLASSLRSCLAHAG